MELGRDKTVSEIISRLDAAPAGGLAVPDSAIGLSHRIGADSAS